MIRFIDQKIWGLIPESEAGPSGFEPESGAPEAPMLSKLYYGPLVRMMLRKNDFAGG